VVFQCATILLSYRENEIVARKSQPLYAASIAQEKPITEEPISLYIPYIAASQDEIVPCRLSDYVSYDIDIRCKSEYLTRMGPFNPPPLPEHGPLTPALVSTSIITEQVKLIASDGESGDRFGKSVAISGDTAIVGAELWDNGANLYQGSAYIFERDQGGTNNWGEVAQLIASDGQYGDACGYDIAINGDIAVMLCPYHDVNGNVNQGAVYIFERHEGGTNNWGESAILIASDGAVNDYLGASIILQNERIVIGADYVTVGGNSSQGAVYIFEKDAGSSIGWTEMAKLTSSDGQANDLFGWDIAMHGNRIISGAPRADVSGKVDQGAIYVYEYDTIVPNQWAEIQKLVASDGMAGDQFGWATAMDGQKLMAGARLADVNTTAYQGATYIYTYDVGATAWLQNLKLTASDGQYGDQFGQSLVKNNNLTLNGAYLGDVPGGYNQGSVYVFGDSLDSIWSNSFITKLIASDAAQDDHFAWATGFSDNYAVTGAYKADVGNEVDQGAAYIHDISAYIDGIPDAVIQTAPNGSSTNQSPNFVWQALNTATGYNLVVYDIDADAIVHHGSYVAIDVCDINTLICTAQLPIGFTLSAGSYRWLIQAFNNAGLGLWSVY